MMTREPLLAVLTDDVEHALASDERARFDEHLAVCPECSDDLHNFETPLRACQCSCGQTSVEGATPIPESLVQAILAARWQG